MNDHIPAFAKGGYGLLLPEIRDGNLIDRGGELKVNRLHGRKIAEETESETGKIRNRIRTKGFFTEGNEGKKRSKELSVRHLKFSPSFSSFPSVKFQIRGFRITRSCPVADINKFDLKNIEL